MSDREIKSLERCIERCTDERVRWLLEDRMKVLQHRDHEKQQEAAAATDPTPVSFWPCKFCAASDLIHAEEICVNAEGCSAQQEMESTED